jgi:hypothetical protein
MRLLSSEEYQDRINPWLNKNLSIAHSIPVSFPQFRSTIVNEAFLFVLTALLLVAMYVLISLLFSLPGLSGSTNVIDNLVATFKNSKALILFSLFVLVYFRAAYFIFSTLRNESSVMIAGFLVMMSIPYIAESMPTFEAWLNDDPINYSSSTGAGVIMWVFVAFVLTKKLVRQFREAQSKKAMKAN